MLVISDTSPLNYLILIDAVHVLPVMYGRVLVPTAVAQELSAAGTPEKARQWFANHPAWIEVHSVSTAISYPELDPGEGQAIALAKSLHADLLLVDERRATSVARDREALRTTGTLGVLLDAALMGLTELSSSLLLLEQNTTFRAPTTLYKQVVQEYERRKKPTGG